MHLIARLRTYFSPEMVTALDPEYTTTVPETHRLGIVLRRRRNHVSFALRARLQCRERCLDKPYDPRRGKTASTSSFRNLVPGLSGSMTAGCLSLCVNQQVNVGQVCRSRLHLLCTIAAKLLPDKHRRSISLKHSHASLLGQLDRCRCYQIKHYPSCVYPCPVCQACRSPCQIISMGPDTMPCANQKRAHIVARTCG
jgi:hypothetical protein